jgi:hypothetical protein
MKQRNIALLIAIPLLMALAALAGDVASRTSVFTASAGSGTTYGQKYWTNSVPYASIQVRYIDLYDIAGGTAGTVTVSRVTPGGTLETWCVMPGSSSSNAVACLVTSNLTTDLVLDDVLKFQANVTNISFKGKITYLQKEH